MTDREIANTIYLGIDVSKGRSLKDYGKGFYMAVSMKRP